MKYLTDVVIGKLTGLEQHLRFYKTLHFSVTFS